LKRQPFAALEDHADPQRYRGLVVSGFTTLEHMKIVDIWSITMLCCWCQCWCCSRNHWKWLCRGVITRIYAVTLAAESSWGSFLLPAGPRIVEPLSYSFQNGLRYKLSERIARQSGIICAPRTNNNHTRFSPPGSETSGRRHRL